MNAKTCLAAFLTLIVAGSSAFAGGLAVMYVVVDRVETASSEGKISSIKIYGSFTRRGQQLSSKFSPPEYGFIQFGAGSEKEAPKWENAAKTGKAVVVGYCGGGGAFETTPIHKCNEKNVGPAVPYTTGYVDMFGDMLSFPRNGDPEAQKLLAFAKTPKIDEDAMDQFITDSVVAGLKEDGVPRKLAGQLGKNPDFLGKCQLCRPTQRGFVKYSELDQQPEGKGVSEELQKRLSSEDVPTRHAALRELIQKYIEKGYASKSLGDEQQKEMRQLIAKHRPRRELNFPNGQRFCPSCDGTACVLKR